MKTHIRFMEICQIVNVWIFDLLSIELNNLVYFRKQFK